MAGAASFSTAAASATPIAAHQRAMPLSPVTPPAGLTPLLPFDVEEKRRAAYKPSKPFGSSANVATKRAADMKLLQRETSANLMQSKRQEAVCTTIDDDEFQDIDVDHTDVLRRAQELVDDDLPTDVSQNSPPSTPLFRDASEVIV